MAVRVAFMGSPEFAVPSLRALYDITAEILVVTQPDRKKGRGRKTSRSPVKEAASELGLEIWQPVTLRSSEAIQRLSAFQPDVYVTAAVGHILTPQVLAIPRNGCLNVHASLLPRWRGASPVSAAILSGDTETGITIIKTDHDIDTGPILTQARCLVRPGDTTLTLTRRLSQLGADLIGQTLPQWLAGKVEPQPQSDEGVTHCWRLQKQDGWIDWHRPAVVIERMSRAYVPWPGTYTTFQGQTLQILEAQAVPDWSGHEQPGTVITLNKTTPVVCGQGILVLQRIQLAGRRAMTPDAFCRGRGEFIGSILGE